MIEHVDIKGVGFFPEMRVELDCKSRITCFVGENGSGKTAILYGIQLAFPGTPRFGDPTREAIMQMCECSDLVIADRIEGNLHPKSQRRLMDDLRAALDEHPQLQVVCSTHSPFIVDCLPAEAVRVLALDKGGRTHCKRLDEHPEWPKWVRSMHAGEFCSYVGEFWTYAGEDWVVQ
jgi:predicted ATP-binding protein involved in virulence